MRKFVLQIDTYEGENLVVSHIFYGKTKKGALAISRAHEQTDIFFRAAMRTGNFKGMILTNNIYQYWVGG